MNKLFKSGIALPEKNAKELENALTEGKKFFNHFNESRMKIAFSVFTEDMKKALYEVIYFLHVNDPQFEKLEYRATKVERVSGIIRETEYRATANLYAPDTLHGVAGIDKLPQAFRQDFYQYVTAEFGLKPTKEMISDFCPIVSISSLGSIGTIGHKPGKSDLDLQILYTLQPFKFNLDEWDSDHLRDALSEEIHSWFLRLCLRKKLDPGEISKTSEIYKELRQQATLHIGKAYPYLYQILFKHKDISGALASTHGAQFKMSVILEMMELITKSYKTAHAEEIERKESLLKQRILAIQDYVQTKFPHAEVYLFSCDCESFQNGQHGTTLESKEASGSAYELILNYEVLMPGIQFAPTIPTHFIFSSVFNNSTAFYKRTVNFLRFHCLPLYFRIDDYLVDMGPTPSLKMSYMLSHIGAAYWESFKAASGNLPKALLNLFRIEVLYHSKYLLTLIEIVKSPEALHHLIPKNYKEIAKEQENDSKHRYGLSVQQILTLEEKIPLLLMDPWWLKYKVLKIYYSDPSIQLDSSERRSISRNIDLCFALHVNLADGFALVNCRSYRERFLKSFLDMAFPPNSSQYLTVKQIFIGEVQAINHFEHDLKNLFSNCLDRIHRIMAQSNIPDTSNQSEFEIWYHFYQQNFDYDPNEIPRNFLSHLKVPRARIVIRYEKSRRRGNWVFSGLTEEKTVGIPTDTATSSVSQDTVLIYEMSFLKGLAYCILNGYYGLVRTGSLSESKTKFQIDLGASDLGNIVDNIWSIIDAEVLVRLADRIVSFFPYRYSHYMDGVKLTREVTEIYFFLHLFKFGRLSILYRDNLQRWYVDEFDHPELMLHAQDFYDHHHPLLQHPHLYKSIDRFLSNNAVNMGNKQLKTDFWYNSMASGHSLALDEQSREKTLSWQFKDAVFSAHGDKNYANEEKMANP
ncbi:MAG: hypothetical protein HQM14_05755 [SAR324 cluster bacterium]|nr:hypothetical protein [SAR324 cluster bacterium]